MGRLYLWKQPLFSSSGDAHKVRSTRHNVLFAYLPRTKYAESTYIVRAKCVVANYHRNTAPSRTSRFCRNWLARRGLPGVPVRSPAAFVRAQAALALCCLAMSCTNAGNIWSCGSAGRYMSLDDKPVWRCLAAGCTGGPFAGQNATKARFHAAQVEGGGIKVCERRV